MISYKPISSSRKRRERARKTAVLWSQRHTKALIDSIGEDISKSIASTVSVEQEAEHETDIENYSWCGPPGLLLPYYVPSLYDHHLDAVPAGKAHTPVADTQNSIAAVQISVTEEKISTTAERISEFDDKQNSAIVTQISVARGKIDEDSELDRLSSNESAEYLDTNGFSEVASIDLSVEADEGKSFDANANNSLKAEANNSLKAEAGNISCRVFDQKDDAGSAGVAGATKNAEDNGDDGFADFSSSAFDKKDDAGSAEATGANKNAEEDGFDAFSSSAFDKRDDAGPLKATGATRKAEYDGFADFPGSAFDKQDHAGTACASGATKEAEDADDEIAAFSSSTFDKRDGPGPTVVIRTNKIVEDDSDGFAVFSSRAFDKKDDAGSAEATEATKNAEVDDGFADFPSSAFDKQGHAGTTCASGATKEAEDADDAIAACSSSAFDKKDDLGNAVVIGATKIVEDDSDGFAALSGSAFDKNDDAGPAEATGAKKNAEVADGFTDISSSALDSKDDNFSFDAEQDISEMQGTENSFEAADKHTSQATNLDAAVDHAELDEFFDVKADNAEGCNSRDAETDHIEKNSSVKQRTEHSFDNDADAATAETDRCKFQNGYQALVDTDLGLDEDADYLQIRSKFEAKVQEERSVAGRIRVQELIGKWRWAPRNGDDTWLSIQSMPQHESKQHSGSRINVEATGAVQRKFNIDLDGEGRIVLTDFLGEGFKSELLQARCILQKEGTLQELHWYVPGTFDGSFASIVVYDESTKSRRFKMRYNEEAGMVWHRQPPLTREGNEVNRQEVTDDNNKLVTLQTKKDAVQSVSNEQKAPSSVESDSNSRDDDADSRSNDEDSNFRTSDEEAKSKTNDEDAYIESNSSRAVWLANMWRMQEIVQARVNFGNKIQLNTHSRSELKFLAGEWVQLGVLQGGPGKWEKLETEPAQFDLKLDMAPGYEKFAAKIETYFISPGAEIDNCGVVQLQKFRMKLRSVEPLRLRSLDEDAWTTTKWVLRVDGQSNEKWSYYLAEATEQYIVWAHTTTGRYIVWSRKAMTVKQQNDDVYDDSRDISETKAGQELHAATKTSAAVTPDSMLKQRQPQNPQKNGIKMRKKGATRTNGAKKRKSKSKRTRTQNADENDNIKKKKKIGRRTKT